MCPLASPGLRHTLPLGTLTRPRALTIHPSKVTFPPLPPSPPPQGLLLWASWALVEEEAGEGEVSVASTTGEERRQVVGGLYWPSGLSLDMTR